MATVKLYLCAVPGAKTSELLRTPEGALRARLAAPPIDGRANRELVLLIARLLGVAPTAVRVVRGTTSRHKVLEVGGLSNEELYARLP